MRNFARKMPWQRWTLKTYDGFIALTWGFALALTMPVSPAFGYVDPSVMTYTFQALAGAAVALSAVMGVAWRRGRKVLERLLDIDPNGSRIKEPPVHSIDPKAPDGPAALALAALQAKESQDLLAGAKGSAGDIKSLGFLDRRPFAPGFAKRFGASVLVVGFFIFTVFFAAPLEIVAGSSTSLVYGVGEVWWLLALVDGVLILGVSLILALLRKGAFALGLTGVFTLGLLAYGQALVMNGGLPAANGASIFWGDYMTEQIITAIIWVIVFIGALLYALHRRRRMVGVAMLGSALLLTASVIGLALTVILGATNSGGSLADEPKGVMTEDGLYSVAAKNNVIVFVLDTFDDAYLRRMLKTDPKLLDSFTGFTDYQNCTGSLIPTRFSVPQMLTGQMPSFDEHFSVYKQQRYNRSNFLETIYDAGYSIGLYTDSLTLGDLPLDQQRAVTGKTMNIHGLPGSAMDPLPTLASLYQMALYRAAPWALKWAFWYYTDQINGAYAAYEDGSAPEETIYVIDDVRYNQRLKAFGLSIDPKEAGAFRFIHLLGSHYPFNYDENADFIGQDVSDVFRQSRGALSIVARYCQDLKTLGLYDQATIIITADHGYWTITEDPIEETSNPIMFVKPAQTPEEAAAPFRFDNKPVSSLDLQATILDAMGLDYSAYGEGEFPGYSMFDDIPENRIRRYITTDSEPDLSETFLREYKIVGDARNFDNWSETGRTLDARI